MSSCPRTPRKFEMFVPTRDNDQRKIRPSVLNHFRNRMVDHFGGATVYDAEGCYLDARNSRQCEPVKVMTATRADINCEKARRDDAKMKELADDIAQYFGQDGVFGVISGVDTFYVEGEKRPRAFPELLER